MGLCTECNTVVPDGEFHPYAFCALRKAGLDPWQEFRTIAPQVGLSDPGEQPPHFTRTVAVSK